MKIFPITLLLLIFLSPALRIAGGTSLHKFYVSTTIIEENNLSNTLEITMKIFTDDLESVLEKNKGDALFLGDEKENEFADEWIEAYLKKFFQLKFNDRSYEMKFLGKEVEYDLTYLYFEIAPLPMFTSLEIQNKILMDLYPEQVNIVHLRFSGWEQTLMIDSKRPEIVVSR